MDVLVGMVASEQVITRVRIDGRSKVIGLYKVAMSGNRTLLASFKEAGLMCMGHTIQALLLLHSLSLQSRPKELGK